MSERLDEYRKEYFCNEFIDIYHFFTKEQLEIIGKLELKIENKKYSVSDFDTLRMDLLKFCNEPNELDKTEVTQEECESILNIFDKIIEDYDL